MFTIEKGEASGRCGWLVLHTDSREILSGDYPLRTKRIGEKFAARLLSLTMADGTLFDWEAPGVPERLTAGHGPDGKTLREALARLRDEVELEAIDARKPRPSGVQSPFGSVTELRAHLRQAAARQVGINVGEAWRLRQIAWNNTLGIAAGGQLIYWGQRGRWVIATSWTALPVADFDIPNNREAYELATWLETHVADAEGAPFPFGAADVKRRLADWRPARGASVELAVWLARAEFDRTKSRAKTYAIDRATGIEAEIARREEVAERAAAGGYAVDTPSGLVMYDEIDSDVTVDERNKHLFAGTDAPGIGETVTLHGAIAGRVTHTEGGVGVTFERGGLRWSQPSGRQGTVVGDSWRFSAYAHPTTVIYRRRAPEIDALGPEAWHWAYAEALARGIGIRDTTIAALRQAVTSAAMEEWELKAFTGDAREYGAELRDAPSEKLDRKLMLVRGFLDERAAWGHLDATRGDGVYAALLVAIAGERQRRRPMSLDEQYWSGPDHAERIHSEDTVDPAALRQLPARVLAGACDYADARVKANAAWRPHVRTRAMDDAGERWQAVAAALAAACPQTPERSGTGVQRREG